MSSVQAETLLYYLQNQNQVSFAKVYDRTGDAVICYEGERAAVIRMIQLFHYEEVELPTGLLESSGRALNNEYQEKLISKVIYHFGRKWLLPAPIRAIYTTVVSVKYIWKGIQTLAQGKIEVPVLDATAIGVSMLRGDYGTAGSVMFLLGVGELLEEWTHKKSVGDLARSMSLNVGKVWLKKDGQEILVPSEKIVAGGRDCRTYGKSDSIRRRGIQRRGYGKPGFSDRRICSGTPYLRFRCLCGNGS